MPTDRERITRLEERWRDLRQDVADLRQENARSRDRLHKLEGTQALLVDDKQRRDQAVKQGQRRLEVRISVLTVAVAVAALLEPLLFHYVGSM